MIRNEPLTQAPRQIRGHRLKRAAVFTSGALVGLVVSTVASYTAVSLFMPHAHSLPTRVASAGGAVLAPVNLPARTPLARPAASSSGQDIRPVESAGILDDGPHEAPTLAAALATATPGTSPSPAPGRRIAMVDPELAGHESLPATAIAPADQDMPQAVAWLRPMPRPQVTTATTGAEAGADFAALAREAGTAAATIAFTQDAMRTDPSDPSGRAAPQADAEITLSSMSAPEFIPALDPTQALGLRPAPRPERVQDALPAVADAIADPDSTPAASALAVLASGRPAPRPQGLVLAAARSEDSPSAAPESFTTRKNAGNASCGRSLARAMPSRRSGAASGSSFFAALGGTSGGDRDRRIIDELARGNMPTFLHTLEPVTFRGKDARGRAAEITVCVTPDYLALGSDRDFVRVPLGLPAAARIAGAFDMTLPTPRMVDAIYSQADVRLSPSPMTPGPQMSSTSYFLRHNATIEGQRHGKSGLISGHKKDVVMASRMAKAPGRVAIYGWHRSAGNPIQPVSTVHGASYADYSHGIRLVSKTAFLNGKPVDLGELLASRQYAYLLNSEGPMPGSVIRIAAR